MNRSKNTTYPALEATIRLGAGVSIDGYMLPSGEFRYALEHISLLMGRAANYYARLLSPQNLHLTKKKPKRLETLLSKGFTAYKIPVQTFREDSRGSSVAYTISFDDLCLVVELEAQECNPKAIALLTASFRELLRNRTCEAFGITQDHTDKKLEDFQESYEDYLVRADILAEDRHDIEALALPGDEVDGYELITSDDLVVDWIAYFYPDFFDPTVASNLHLNYEGRL